MCVCVCVCVGGGLYNLGISFRSSIKQWYVVCTHKNRLDEAILMSSYSIHFHEVRISHDKRAIDVRAIKVLLNYGLRNKHFT